MTPTEDQEAVMLAQWLSIQKLPATHVANESGRDAYARRRAIRMKRQGVSKGFFDYIVFIPAVKSKDGEAYCLCIELKRAKKSLSRLTPEQKEWQDKVNDLGTNNIQAYVAYGANEAIRVISHYLKSTDNSIF